MGVSVGVGVRGNVPVGVTVGLIAKVTLGVMVGEPGVVNLGAEVAVGWGTVGVRDGEDVGVAVRVTVAVAVRVAVGELVTVGLAVPVALGTGWFPIWMVICDTAPKFPSRSRSCTVSLVSPGGKLLSAFITWQNCTTCGPEERKAGEPKPSTVHACVGLVLKTKPQAKSLSAFDIACVILKSGGLSPGMPPPSHTPAPPSPSGREVSICRSGRALGSLICQLKTTVPTGAPLFPATASITSWNPEPTGRWNSREPSAANPTSGINPPSGAARAKTATTGPGRGVGVGLGSVRVSFNSAGTSAALSALSALQSQS